ncbi:MAG: EF-hand domain-containing protein [Saprospiraceae bacterium]|nr:EF-hand domain-containing protein [Saprospiraceae bacterium]MBL0024081.1 EF-hand domain-containing protein [Saprospiraceae bacterium]
MIIASMVSCSSNKKATASEQPSGTQPSLTELFAQMDSNKDGKLSTSEVKGPLANDFSKIDTNGDGFISQEELEKAPKPNRQRPQQGQRGQQGPPNGGN